MEKTEIKTTDFEIAKSFKLRFGRKFKIGIDEGDNGETLGCFIRTTFRTKEGNTPPQVWLYSEDVFHALLPAQSAKKILESFSFVKLVLKTDEGTILGFPSDRLQELEKCLKLRRRRKLSPDQRKKASERLHPFKFTPHVTNKTSPDFES